jgi:hypothetical protein
MGSGIGFLIFISAMLLYAATAVFFSIVFEKIGYCWEKKRANDVDLFNYEYDPSLYYFFGATWPFAIFYVPLLICFFYLMKLFFEKVILNVISFADNFGEKITKNCGGDRDKDNPTIYMDEEDDL